MHFCQFCEVFTLDITLANSVTMYYSKRMSYNLQQSPLYTLLRTGKQLKMPKGQVIGTFYSQPMLHLVDAGFVKRYMITEDGTKAIQVIYGPQEILPLTPVYETIYEMAIYRGPVTYYYEAMTPVSLYSIPLNALLEAITANPLIYKDLFYASGTRLNSYIHRLEDMSLKSVQKRICHMLLYFADKFGTTTSEGIQIAAPLTHQILADSLNMARETVTRTLVALSERKLVATAGQGITILDTEGLKSEIGQD